MTPEEAFDAAMRYENRANPYPFFDELRKTPVARVTHSIYAVTGYEELIALAHDPRVSSDRRKGRSAVATEQQIVDDGGPADDQADQKDDSTDRERHVLPKTVAASARRCRAAPAENRGSDSAGNT